MQKKRGGVRPFRVLALVLGACAVGMLIRFPGKVVSLENQRVQLEEAATAYYNAKAENNRLNAKKAEIKTDEYVERVARRELGYCWYGETVYVVGNLDELRQEPAVDVEAQE